jgi:hypothetical protein
MTPMPDSPDEIEAEAVQAEDAQPETAVTVPPEDQIPVQPTPDQPTPEQGEPAAPPVEPPAVPTLKVEAPHSSFSYGGVTIWAVPTPVHPSLIPAIMQSADEAGVTITQEG